MPFPTVRPARERLPRRGAFLRAVLLILGVSGLLSLEASSDPEPKPAPEFHLKAAFLYNFALFTDWPAESFEDKDSPLVVAVVGKDPFGDLLEATFREKRAKGRVIQVQRYASVKALGRCDVLFVPRSESERLGEIRRRLAGQHVLLVGESTGFALKGGIVNFYLKDKAVAFEINPKEAARAKLTISSRLLKLARIVEEKEEVEDPGADDRGGSR